MSYQVISHKLVKTRKPHRCWGCTKEFPVGSMLWNCVSKEDVITSTYWCEPCQDLFEQCDFEDVADGLAFGELTEWEEEVKA